jgi:hypothetical protein
MEETKMTEAISAKIGFLSAISSASPHFNSFKALIPNDVQFDFIGLELVDSSLYELKGRKETVLKKTLELAERHQWQGVILSGAPVELLNPGLLDALRSSLAIPVTSALASSVAALKRFSVKRALLMTPFDEPLNQMIRDYLANAEIEAFSPPTTLRHFTEALKLSPEEVNSLTKKALEGHQDVDAIYFQGAVLDPLKVLERMESELNTTVVASNPAMLWYMLSRLGLGYKIQGYGRLLAEWPKLPQ